MLFLSLISQQFVLPDGHEVYGVLMEYVAAPSLGTGVARSLSREQQLGLVRVLVLLLLPSLTLFLHIL